MKEVIQRYAEAYAIAFALEGEKDRDSMEVALIQLEFARAAVERYEKDHLNEAQNELEDSEKWNIPKAFAWFIAGFSLSMIIFKFI